MLHAHTDVAACGGNDRNEMQKVLGILTTTENRDAWVERVSFDCHATPAMRDALKTVGVDVKTTETWFSSYLNTSSLSCEFPCLSRSSSSSNRWERLLKWHISSESSPEKKIKSFRCPAQYLSESISVRNFWQTLAGSLRKTRRKSNMTWNINIVPIDSLGTRLLKHSLLIWWRSSPVIRTLSDWFPRC